MQNQLCQIVGQPGILIYMSSHYFLNSIFFNLSHSFVDPSVQPLDLAILLVIKKTLIPFKIQV